MPPVESQLPSSEPWMGRPYVKTHGSLDDTANGTLDDVDTSLNIIIDTYVSPNDFDSSAAAL